jgi:hypothetical protein
MSVQTEEIPIIGNGEYRRFEEGQKSYFLVIALDRPIGNPQLIESITFDDGHIHLMNPMLVTYTDSFGTMQRNCEYQFCGKI